MGKLLYLGNCLYGEETQGDAGYLLLGGMLLGDTFHTISLLNWLTKERGRRRIVWWSGAYAREAVEFLKEFYPIESRYFRDGVPTEIRDRDRFLDAHLPRWLRTLRGRPWEGVPFDSKANRDFALQNRERLGAVPGNFVVIHPASRHSWKNVPAIQALDWRQFGLPVITVGAKGEPLIPGSLDLRGRPFAEVARALAAARITVGIHSAVSCLSLYLRRPLIVCAPGDDEAYARFAELSPKVLDLTNPGETELAEAVGRQLAGTETGAATLDAGRRPGGPFGQTDLDPGGIEVPRRPG